MQWHIVCSPDHPFDLPHVCAAGSHLTGDHESLGDRAGAGESGGANGTKRFSTTGTCRGKFSLMVLELRSQPFNFILLLQNATLVLQQLREKLLTSVSKLCTSLKLPLLSSRLSKSSCEMTHHCLPNGNRL